MKFLALLCFSVILLLQAFCKADDLKYLPEEFMTPLELIKNQGYNAENHEIHTTDGYILSVQRITSGRKEETKKGKKPVVILQHGLEGCSENYIGNLYNQSLGFILADAGYDVWIPNSRGNRYSLKHEVLDYKDDAEQFFDFSWQEMASLDLPAVLEHSLLLTGNTQAFYVGHSQGTLIMFAKLSEDSRFRKKIRMFAALAPVTTVTYISSPIKALAPYADTVQDILGKLGVYSFNDNAAIAWAETILRPVCEEMTDNAKFCNGFMAEMLGPENNANINQTRSPEFKAHNPAGTSVKNIAHFAQLINAKQMQKFDYSHQNGPLGNLAHYGTLHPPVYDLTKIDNKVLIYWSANDTLADPTDVHQLIPQLKNVVVHEVPDYSHTDFIRATNAQERVYKSIVEAFNQDLKQHP